MAREELKCEDGKYTFFIENGKIGCLLYGERWIDEFGYGSKALMALMYECLKYDNKDKNKI